MPARCRTGRRTPDDLKAAIREIKAALRARIAASGRTVEEVFAVIEARVAERVDEIAAAKARGETVWPVIDYADIEAGTVAAEQLGMLHRRGCLVVRGHFEREQAARLGPRHRRLRRVQPVLRELPRARATTSSAASAPSPRSTRSTGRRRRCRPARATAWPASRRSSTPSGRHESDGVQWFDPDRDSLYPDRIRRRPPGANSGGLGTHLDPGTLDLWMTQAYQQAFRHLFDGTVEQYDPWDAAHRTAGPQYPGSTMCSAFRTFQGWTALSDMDHDQGVLHTVPIPEAMGYLMLRPLLADVPDDDMCGVTVNQVFPASEQWHPLLLRRAQRHPRRQGRRLRLVALRHDPQRRPGRATSRAGATSCTSPPPPGARATRPTPRRVREAFLTGSSPSDFPDEHYERNWPNRFQARAAQRHRPTRPRASRLCAWRW